MLLRKVERIDSVKPWQPSLLRKGATFYSPLASEITNTNIYHSW
ncbi:hypothetical protein HNQ03_002772 [Chryseobacterium sp. 16F]|uniref:Uncharacterized protein n=1 Tax=Frigoriflavimonas asaccharolytica TaxID=2735899 RepID=A0A8J8GA22_9FLAO|nr:hypothetical protein [Frigoriflavimonas asaccharolytica]